MAAAQSMPSTKPFKHRVWAEIQLSHFSLDIPKEPPAELRSGNYHKRQISCVSTSNAENRQEHKNRHAWPFNWAQGEKKTFQQPSGAKSNSLPRPAGVSQIIPIHRKHQRTASAVHWHAFWNDQPWLQDAVLCMEESGSRRDFKHSEFTILPSRYIPEIGKSRNSLLSVSRCIQCIQ